MPLIWASGFVVSLGALDVYRSDDSGVNYLGTLCVFCLRFRAGMTFRLCFCFFALLLT